MKNYPCKEDKSTNVNFNYFLNFFFIIFIFLEMMFGTDKRGLEMNFLEMAGAHKSYVVEGDHN
jgi:hypothetical protein